MKDAFCRVGGAVAVGAAFIALCAGLEWAGLTTDNAIMGAMIGLAGVAALIMAMTMKW